MIMDLANLSRYHTPKNSPNKPSSDSSKYFTPDSVEASLYSTPNIKYSNQTINGTKFYTPKSKNVTICMEATRFYTPQKNSTIDNSSTIFDSRKYSTPMNGKSSKALRFIDNERFDSPKSRLLQSASGETFSSLMKQTWVDSDTDSTSKLSEDQSQDRTLTQNEPSQPPINNTNPFLDVFRQQFDNVNKYEYNNNSKEPKLENIIERLEFLNGEFVKMKKLEEQMLEMSQQIAMLRENLVKQSLESYDMAKQLLDDRIFASQQQKQNTRRIQEEIFNEPKLRNPPPQKSSAATIEMKRPIFQQYPSQQIIQQKENPPIISQQTNIKENNIPKLIKAISNSSIESSSESELDDDHSKSLNLAIMIRSKLRRLPALVKGYLTRRLAATQKVQELRKTIHDTSLILVNFKKNLLNSEGSLVVKHEDIQFHQQLCNQLESACQEFYKIFFGISRSAQLAMIRRHREYLKEINSRNSERSQSALSNATSHRSTSSQNSIPFNRNRNFI